MPAHEYDILLTATIEIGGKYKADSIEEAKHIAVLELRAQGELSNVTFERAIYLPPADLLSDF